MAVLTCCMQAIFCYGQTAGGCDKLIIAVNTDSSVKRLKGEERPVQPQEVRSAILANLPFVDAVILFEEDTPKR